MAELLDEAAGGNARMAQLHGPGGFQEKAKYSKAFQAIQKYIRAGDVYQVNYTGSARLELDGDPLALYSRLRSAQPVPFGALISSGEFDILSCSPEQFLTCDGHTLQARPMKGTAPRGRFPAEDDSIRSDLSICEKTRSENLMIVDLVRNDLSRVTEAGSVKVKSLFDIQTLPSVHQMTSTIEGRILDGVRPSDLMNALFPCGSVTGAPKIRAMEIIDDLEGEARGVYCGAIGWFGPGARISLNVPIRTLMFDKSGLGRVHVGSGLVADSDLEAEYAECQVKASFLRMPVSSRDLIETIGWSAISGFRNLELHLDRLTASASWLGWQPDRAAIIAGLDDLAGTLDGQAEWRIRLVCGEGLPASITATRMMQADQTTTPTVCLADRSVDSTAASLFHKLADRTFYEDALTQARERHPDLFDCVLTNERGELTEGSFTNLFVQIDGKLLTPPMTCGLLPGILRQQLIGSGKARESILLPDQLETADAVFLGNSLRGLIQVKVI